MKSVSLCRWQPRILGALAIVALTLGTEPVLGGETASEPAAESGVVREAKELTRSGIAHYRAGDLEHARADFAKAWALKPSVELAAGLAEVEMKLERYADAAEHWAYYLQNLPPDRTEAEYQLAECRKHLGSVRVAVDTPGATVSLDGKVLGPAPLRVDVWVAPGAHAFEAKAQGRAAATQQISIGAGEAQLVTLMLGSKNSQREPSATAVSPGNSDRSVDDAPKSSAAKTVTVITGSALALAGIGVGVGFTLKSNAASREASSLYSQLDDASGGNPSAYCQNASTRSQHCDDYLGKVDEKDQARALAIAGFATGGTFALATVIALLVWPNAPASSQATLPHLTVSDLSAERTVITLSGAF